MGGGAVSKGRQSLVSFQYAQLLQQAADGQGMDEVGVGGGAVSKGGEGLAGLHLQKYIQHVGDALRISDVGVGGGPVCQCVQRVFRSRLSQFL